MDNINRITLRNQTELAYRVINPDSAGSHAIIFLHEGIGSIEMWKDFPDNLCRKTGLKGIVYDRAGYGHSSAAATPGDASYLHKAALEELPEFLDKVNVQEQLILFGHSDGGSIAYIFGSRYPEEVAGIITEAAHVFVEPVTLEGIKDTAERFANTDLREKLRKYHGDKTDAVFSTWVDTWLSDTFRDWNIEPLLTNISCPVLVIQGSEDEYGTDAQVDSIVRNTNGLANPIILGNCGHSPHIQQQEKILEVSADFINKLI